jgi:hypothetical protein
VRTPSKTIAGNNYKGTQGTCTFPKIGTNKLPGAIGTIKLPERQIIGSSYSICDLNQFFAACHYQKLPFAQYVGRLTVSFQALSLSPQAVSGPSVN